MTTYEEADEFCPHCDNHYVSGRRGLDKDLVDQSHVDLEWNVNRAGLA